MLSILETFYKPLKHIKQTNSVNIPEMAVIGMTTSLSMGTFAIEMHDVPHPLKQQIPCWQSLLRRHSKEHLLGSSCAFDSTATHRVGNGGSEISYWLDCF